MKKQFSLLLLLLASIGVQAQIPPIMVCNLAGDQCAPYHTLNEAYQAANSGDFIYLPGGHYTLNDSIEKEVHIYGAGSDADSSQATGRTYIDGTVNIGTGAHNSHFEGFIGNVNAYSVVEGITIKRCQISISCSIGAHINNSLFLHNIIGNYILGSAAATQGSGNLIQNCLITGTGSGLTYCTIRNCTMTGYFTSANGYGGSGCRGCSALRVATYNTIENCVMHCGINEACPPNLGDTPGLPVANNYIRNTLIRRVIVISSEIGGYGGASEVTNVEMVSYDSPLFTEDSYYVVIPLSTADNGGSDGTDMGMHGGSIPWVYGVVPTNPHIYFKQISGATNEAGDLPVQIKARSGDQ